MLLQRVLRGRRRREDGGALECQDLRGTLSHSQLACMTRRRPGSLCQEDTACCPHHLCSPAPRENGPHGDPLIAALPASSLLPSRQPQPHPHRPPQPLRAPGPQRRGGGANPHSRFLLLRAPSSPPGVSSQQVSIFLTSWGPSQCGTEGQVSLWLGQQMQGRDHIRDCGKNEHGRGFPGGSGVESACRCRRHGFHPWSGRIPCAAEQLSP